MNILCTHVAVGDGAHLVGEGPPFQQVLGDVAAVLVGALLVGLGTGDGLGRRAPCCSTEARGEGAA